MFFSSLHDGALLMPRAYRQLALDAAAAADDTGIAGLLVELDPAQPCLCVHGPASPDWHSEELPQEHSPSALAGLNPGVIGAGASGLLQDRKVKLSRRNPHKVIISPGSWLTGGFPGPRRCSA